MLSVWDWMDGWKITEILYAALSWELSKQTWFLAQHDMILAVLHPKIYGRMAGLSCMSPHCSSWGSFLSASCHGQRVAWGLVHPPWTTRLSGIVSYQCHPWESLTALFLTSLWFLSQLLWGSEPSSACQSLNVNLFSLRPSSTSLPTALLCR